MPLDPSLIGRTYPPLAYEVGREKIREFAAAIGADAEVHRDPDAARKLGHPDVIAPPTFPIVFTMASELRVFQDPELDLDFSRVVHGDQRFRYERPIFAGDRLRCVSVIEDVTVRGGHGFMTARSEVTTEDGEPVATAWAKLVIRGEE